MNGNALSYLLRTKIHNQLVSFFKKPVRLIYVVIFIGLLVLTMIGGNAGAKESDRVVRDISELTAGINALFILIFATTFNSGLKNGGTFFKMADVNYLFPSPLNKRSILFYALIQQIWSSMLIGIFILFQYSALHMNYNLSYLGLTLIFLTYSLTVFLSQTLGMFLYTFVSDSEKKKNIAKAVLYIIIVGILAYIGLHVLQNKDHIVKALAEAGNGLPVLLFPFAGWIGGFAGSIFKGEYIESALWLILSAAAFTAMLIAMSRSKREYYEDVIASAETMQNTINSAKDGVPPEATPKVIKVGKEGIGKGNGASVFFYKHMLENRRASKIWIKPMSLVFVLITIGFTIFMKGAGILPIFAFSVYMQVFTVALGRFNRELTKPFIYLVPESPFKKIIYALAETFPTELLESALIFIPVSIILGAPALVCILCIVGRMTFSFLFIASSIAIERLWGGSLSKVAGLLIYFVVDILLSAPGIVLAVVLSASGITLFSSDITSVMSITLMNIPVASLIIYSCRNVLQYAEL
ncbi:MAG: hypothetical protein CVU91_01725 [Firmicutes bacterium HGW-Firmicutes-16]|nr:MAG: hypothetical protein CVU91_01725 [Firmicutes bacterium HGW-Firmicutes-16]